MNLPNPKPGRSNDNALVKYKNGHVLRKLLGYAHIPQQCAATLNEFHRQHLNRYVNYHRPCLFAQVELDERGRQRRCYRYEDVQTPYEKLKSLPDAEQNFESRRDDLKPMMRMRLSTAIKKLPAVYGRHGRNYFFQWTNLQRTQA